MIGIGYGYGRTFVNWDEPVLVGGGNVVEAHTVDRWRDCCCAVSEPGRIKPVDTCGLMGVDAGCTGRSMGVVCVVVRQTDVVVLP